MDSYSGSGIDKEIDQEGTPLPEYVPYLSLMFKLIATIVNLLLSGWVVYTIKTTRSLHKPHNIFVANLLVSGMITTLIGCVIASSMMISYQLGLELFNGCSALKYSFLPSYVNNLSLVIIAADKVIAITSPFKHKRTMTPHVVAAVVTGAWLLALIPFAVIIVVDVDGYTQVAEYGICYMEGDVLTVIIFAYMTLLFISPIFTITLNVYLAIKAYKVHMMLHCIFLKPVTLSDWLLVAPANLVSRSICLRHKKPIVTLLVIVLGSIAFSLLFSTLHLLGRLLVNSQAYHNIWKLAISQNTTYVARFFHPLVYGLYFKQVRKPMLRCLKKFWKIHKVNSVAPQP